LTQKLDIKIYAVLVMAVLIYKVAEQFYGSIVFFSAYFEDVLALPILLKTSLLIVQYTNKDWSVFLLDRAEVIAIAVVFSIYFEGVLPYFDYRFTADPLDIACYFFGAWFYSTFLNKALVVN